MRGRRGQRDLVVKHLLPVLRGSDAL